MPETYLLDALHVSPLGNGCQLVTAGSGEKGRCHTSHAHLQPVAKTGPRRKACKVGGLAPGTNTSTESWRESV